LSALKSCKDSAPGPDGIPYSVYKKLWGTVGDYVHKAWLHSMKTNTLPASHVESVITLLPKDGKNLKDIKNWRPITLSNCDAKIITKALAMRMANVLNDIIDPSQTAYVPGRSVIDNIRSNMFTKQHCKLKNIDAILVSLDARKAFDSVSHDYIEMVLKNYGFGPNVIRTFRILYSHITARVLVNGFFSDSIRIERGVKQGDALSCAIFILCIDPLIRNLNQNSNIKGIQFQKKLTKKKFQHKSCGYADDISVICRDTKESLQGIFSEYQKLTNISGLELNADKTEILRINNLETKKYHFNYLGCIHTVTNVEKIKICGIYFSDKPELEKQLNVNDKITKMKCKLKPWNSRGLSVEGKILLVKTFGLSQLIYNMQCIDFDKESIKVIESKMFHFIWAKSGATAGSRSIDRIKRSILKNDFGEGGLRATDVDSLNLALKLKQYIRSSKANHVIREIQEKSVEDSNQLKVIQPDFTPTNGTEIIVERAQLALNSLIDHSRKVAINNIEESANCRSYVDQISSIKVKHFLKNQNKTMSLCIYNHGFGDYETLLDLVREAETERDKKRSKLIEMILSNFPKELRRIALCFDENINLINNDISEIHLDEGWVKIEELTVKIIQGSLKTALGKTTTLDVKSKVGIEEFDRNNFIKVRQQCTNTKMRTNYHRLINNDFFSHERMFKFNMTNNDKCPRCNQIETTRHMLWECRDAGNIWRLLNEIMVSASLSGEQILKYLDIYKITENSSITHIKMKIIQEMIQIDRPKGWNRKKLIDTIQSVANIEKYIYKKNKSENKWKSKWKIINSLNGI
jgi:hypothetical protein